MPGALLQLVARGHENVALDDNPQVTPFKTIYRRHTPLSLTDDIEAPADTNAYLFGSDVTHVVGLKGDLLHKAYVIVDLPKIRLLRREPTWEYVNTVLSEYNVPPIVTSNSEAHAIGDDYTNVIVPHISLHADRLDVMIDLASQALDIITDDDDTTNLVVAAALFGVVLDTSDTTSNDSEEEVHPVITSLVADIRAIRNHVPIVTSADIGLSLSEYLRRSLSAVNEATVFYVSAHDARVISQSQVRELFDELADAIIEHTLLIIDHAIVLFDAAPITLDVLSGLVLITDLVTRIKRQHRNLSFASGGDGTYNDDAVIADVIATIARENVLGPVFREVTNHDANDYRDAFIDTLAFSSDADDGGDFDNTAHAQLVQLINSYQLPLLPLGLIADANAMHAYKAQAINRKQVLLQQQPRIASRLYNVIHRITPKFAWARELGHRIFKQHQLFIDDRCYSNHDPLLLSITHKIYDAMQQDRGYDILIGNTRDMYSYTYPQQKQITRLIIPLHRWFTDHAGAALPLINMLYSRVMFKFRIADLDDVLLLEPDTRVLGQMAINVRMLLQYVFLDNDERMRMATTPAEYLIEDYNSNDPIRIAGQAIDTIIASATLSFDWHIVDPSKFLIWCVRIYIPGDEATRNWCDCGLLDMTRSDLQFKPCNTISLSMNDVRRVGALPEEYYRLIVPYESRTAHSFGHGQYMYSFALYPCKPQPSGSANYTEIDTSTCTMTLSDDALMFLLANKSEAVIEIHSWSRSYNVLRVISGIAAPVFAESGRY